MTLPAAGASVGATTNETGLVVTALHHIFRNNLPNTRLKREVGLHLAQYRKNAGARMLWDRMLNCLMEYFATHGTSGKTALKVIKAEPRYFKVTGSKRMRVRLMTEAIITAAATSSGEPLSPALLASPDSSAQSAPTAAPALDPSHSPTRNTVIPAGPALAPEDAKVELRIDDTQVLAGTKALMEALPDRCDLVQCTVHTFHL
jgi:hypothetical protein